MRRTLLVAAIFAAIVAVCTLLAMPARSQGLVSHVYAGANGAWLDGPGSAFPADFEAGGSASASLSPHLSAVGETYYGFSHSYVRWSGGVRATVSDVDNPDFNTFLGISYRGGSTSAVQPGEWAPDAGFGWRVAPSTWPNLLAVGRAGYGLTSNRVLLTLGLRWEVPLR